MTIPPLTYTHIENSLTKKDSRIQRRTFIRQHKHVDKHLNKWGNITVHEY